SLSFLCMASGFNFGDFAMNWVRQEPGKGIKWITGINYNGGGATSYTPSVKGRCSISRDNTQSTVTLQLSSLRDQDSATYYCCS
ncbi:HV320 protein, partial [Alcedo cyanopectus]|nr:HV320 protein [Ceyx cyanopectus]